MAWIAVESVASKAGNLIVCGLKLALGIQSDRQLNQGGKLAVADTEPFEGVRPHPKDLGVFHRGDRCGGRLSIQDGQFSEECATRDVPDITTCNRDLQIAIAHPAERAKNLAFSHHDGSFGDGFPHATVEEPACICAGNTGEFGFR